MGLSCSRGLEGLDDEPGGQLKDIDGHFRRPEPVRVNIYDVGTSGGSSVLNSLLRPMGAGAFHCGVEVYGLEWSFSDAAGPARQDSLLRSGIFSSWPKKCKGHRFKESMEIGFTAKSEVQVLMLISKMEEKWPLSSYDVLSKNCCHFADELCVQLGVGHIPPLLMKLAELGASLVGMGQSAATLSCCSERYAAAPCCDFLGKSQQHVVVIDLDQEIEKVNAFSAMRDNTDQELSAGGSLSSSLQPYKSVWVPEATDLGSEFSEPLADPRVS